MGTKSIHQFSVLGHEIEILEEQRSIPGVANFEERLGIETRYGLKFNGEITDWSDFTEQFEDAESAMRIAEKGKTRALKLGPKPTT